MSDAPDCIVPFRFVGIVHSRRDAAAFLSTVRHYPGIPCGLMLRSPDHSPLHVLELCRALSDMKLPANLTVISNNLRVTSTVWSHWPAFIQPDPSERNKCWGTSIHDARELERAEALGASYGIVSPVFHTGSKPDAKQLEGNEISAIVKQSSIPLFALGGIVEPRLVLDVEEMGFAGCAVGSLAESERAGELRSVLNEVSHTLERSNQTRFEGGGE